MKKITAYALVLCLLLNLSFFNTAFAEDDFFQAAEILFAMEFMEKIEDEPALDTVVSRADFAVMVVKMLGAEQKTNKLYFEDVPANHFAKDAISIAFELGIINGVDEKHFDPDAPLSYEQAVKILVATLGYEQAAQQKAAQQKREAQASLASAAQTYPYTQLRSYRHRDSYHRYRTVAYGAVQDSGI